MIRAAIYCRVSSGHQEQEATVESQREAVRAHAAEKGYTVVDEFVDEAYSGATVERPGLDRLRDAARDAKFDRLVILSPDRLARNVAYQFLILKELQKVGVTVEFLQGQPADTPEGQLLLTMQGAIAEYERAKISERTRRGKQFWARRGGLMGGYTPYGYRYVPRNGDHRATLTPDPTTAPVVRAGSSWKRVAPAAKSPAR
jgi:site-specific DNA recombinase